MQKHIVQGIPDQKIPEIVTKLKADLVVMGTISRVGIAGVIIGNTAENVLSQINTSVLTIKPAGFKAPM
ncbi:universal stress protein [Aeromonas veronii]|nr:universal stress protein [Aeromonas veronii]